jgi:hypothetical protein
MQLHTLHGLVSRLIWCSGALRLPLARHHPAIKWTARKIAQVNRGVLHDDTLMRIPDSTIACINAWIADIDRKRVLPPRAGDSAYFTELVTDASLHGWGAVFRDGFGRVYIAGSKWSNGEFAGITNETLQSGDIGRLEARGLRNGYDAFRDLIKETGTCIMHVDNTSVRAAVHRGAAKADSINTEIRPLLDTLVADDIRYAIRYVKSEDNIADGISRGKRLTREEVERFYG